MSPEPDALQLPHCRRGSLALPPREALSRFLAGPFLFLHCLLPDGNETTLTSQPPCDAGLQAFC